MSNVGPKINCLMAAVRRGSLDSEQLPISRIASHLNNETYLTGSVNRDFGAIP